ncbi:MAG: Coq4 family protein [Betaproteobacteria bacterium]
MLDYQHPRSRLTLAEGLAEYFAAYPGLAGGRDSSPQAQEFFRCHDTAHVVFGCGIALDDELVVKIASLFGTTAGFSVLKGYRLHESLEVYGKLRVADVLRSTVRSFAIVPRTFLRCRRQARRWPWLEFEPYLAVPLCDIREAFGIRVAHDIPTVPAGAASRT